MILPLLCCLWPPSRAPIGGNRHEVVLVARQDPSPEKTKTSGRRLTRRRRGFRRCSTNWACGATRSATPPCSTAAWQRRQIAVLAYHPKLSDAADAALARFVQSGGKLLVCYLLPPRLAAALGFRDAQYVRQQRPGQFAEIRFETTDIAGLPPSVRQDSWNLIVPRPTGFNARIVGRWYDDAGQPTGRAALLVSDRGAVLTHILLSDDREGKKQMLAALLGHFSPPLWRRMAPAALDRAGRAGHCGNFEETAAVVQAGGDPAARQALDAAAATLAAARRDFAAGRFVAAAAAARRGHDQVAEAYLRAQTSARAKPAPSGTIRARGRIPATGTARPASWPATAST